MTAPRRLPRSWRGHGGSFSAPPHGAACRDNDTVATERGTPPPGSSGGGPGGVPRPVQRPSSRPRGAAGGAPRGGSRSRGHGRGSRRGSVPGSRTRGPAGTRPRPARPARSAAEGGGGGSRSPRLRALRTSRGRALIGRALPVTSAGSLPIGRPVAGTVGLPGSHLTRSAPPPRTAPAAGPRPSPVSVPAGPHRAGGAISAAGSGAAAPPPSRPRRRPGIAALSGRGGAPGVARGLGRERGDWRGGRPADTPPLEKGRREWRGEKVNTAGRPCPRTGRGGRGSAPDVMGPGAAAPGQQHAGRGAGGLLSPGPCAGPGPAARAALPPRRLRAAPGGRR